MNPITITIDGPAGSGKGTTARLLAEKMGFKYLDTGAMWRALGIFLSGKGVDLEHVNEKDLGDIHIDFSPDNRVRMNGDDYESRIRTVEASSYASQLAAQKDPRHLVIGTGQRIIQDNNYVLEGRDTGTVWAPYAQIKVYLTADPIVRAHRRWLELQQKGEKDTEDEVLKKIIERDDRDKNRPDGPLIKPEGAHEIDTTHLTIEEQVEKIYEIVQEKLRVKIRQHSWRL